VHQCNTIQDWSKSIGFGDPHSVNDQEYSNNGQVFLGLQTKSGQQVLQKIYIVDGDILLLALKNYPGT